MTIPNGTIASRAKANTTHRQKLKKKWDRHCKYSADDIDSMPKSFELDGSHFSADVNPDKNGENWCRLLDEGVVVDNNFFTGEPYVYAVIEKGVIKKWFDALPDNFVGTIDKDHNRSIGLGTFTKKDLKLVELENGRYAIDVNVKLDHELYAVKDLIRENNRTALSVEMFCDADEFATADKVTGDKNEGKYLVPLISKLKIEGYAVCLAPKSANSYKDNLLEKASSNTNVNEEIDMNKKVNAAAGDPNAEPTDVEPTVVDNTDEVENDTKEGTPIESEDVETTDAEVTDAEVTDVEADTDEPADSEDKTEESDGEEPEESEDETKDESEEAEKADLLSAVEEQVKQLKATIVEKDEKIAELEAQLADKSTKESNFESKLSHILSMASSEEPTKNESATTPEKTDGDDIVDIYKSAFNELENS